MVVHELIDTHQVLHYGATKTYTRALSFISNSDALPENKSKNPSQITRTWLATLRLSLVKTKTDLLRDANGWTDVAGPNGPCKYTSLA